MQAQGLVSTRYTGHPSRFVAQPALTVQLLAIPQNNLYVLWGLAAREGTKEEITIQSGVWPPGKASGMLGSAHNLPSRFCALPDECVTPATPMITRNYLTELGRSPITSTGSPNIAVHQEVGVPRMGHSYC